MSIIGQFILIGAVAAFRMSRLELANRETLPSLREAEQTVVMNLIVFCGLLPLTCFGLVGIGVAVVTLGASPTAGMPSIPFALLWIGLCELLLRGRYAGQSDRWEELPTVPVFALVGKAYLRLLGLVALGCSSLIVIGIALLRPCASREKAYFQAMRSDLEAVSLLQQDRVERGLPFTSSLEELGLEPFAGVTLTLANTRDGWSGVAKHYAFGPSEYCSASVDSSVDRRWPWSNSVNVECTR